MRFFWTIMRNRAIMMAHEIRIQKIVKYPRSDYGQGMSIREDDRAWYSEPHAPLTTFVLRCQYASLQIDLLKAAA
jgi:hypothetical protein